MADPFRSINAGQDYPLSATYRNAVVEMLKWFRNQGGARGIGIKQIIAQTGIVDCKNTSDGDLARFSALAIDSVFPDPSDNAIDFANGPILRGITPTASTDPGNFCVLLEPALDKAIVRACVAGVCVAKINVNDADDSTCGVSTTAVLQSGKQGAQILWKETGTGTKYAVIRIGSVDEVLKFISDMDVPEFAIMVIDETVTPDTDTLNLTQATKLIPGPFYINISDVLAGNIGLCHPLNDTPRRTLIDFETAISKNWPPPFFEALWTGSGNFLHTTQWGAIPGSWKLGLGLPGAHLAGPQDTFNDETDTVYAIAAPVPMFWGKATQNWRSAQFARDFHVTVNPSILLDGTWWDGEDGVIGSGGEDAVETVIILSASGTGSVAPQRNYINQRIPNIEAGDIILCTGKSRARDGGWPGIDIHPWQALSDYMDDPIGTIKFSTNATSPKGWGIMDGTENSVENGGSGKNLVSHLAMGASSFAGSGSTFLTGAGSGLDYWPMVIIERLDNRSGDD